MQNCGNVGQLTCQEMYALRNYANAKPIAGVPELFWWIFSFFILIEGFLIISFIYSFLSDSLELRRSIVRKKKLRAL